jgi:hypothetical protein
MEVLNKKIELGLVCLLVIFTSFAGQIWAMDDMSNPNWYIMIWDSGYSDWMISPHGHEQLSGEWAAAVLYDQIPIGEAMWLEPEWICPDWISNSNFQVITPFLSWDDPFNPVLGKDTGQGVISNGQLEITIDCVMREDRTVVGLSPAVEDPDHILSHLYVMFQTYKLKNITDQTLTTIALFQMIHGQPNDDYGTNNYAVYDPTPYSVLEDMFPEYHYDLTCFGPDAQWSEWYDDIIGFSSDVRPNAWGLGEFPGHGGEPGPISLHHSVEVDALGFGSFVGPLEVAGVMKWALGDLEPGQQVDHTVLFFTGHSPAGLPPSEVRIYLEPEFAANELGVVHNLTATATLDDSPVPGVTLVFEVVDGPHVSISGEAMTDASGKAEFSYTGSTIGTDLILASADIDNDGDMDISNVATKEWIAPSVIQVVVDIKPTSCPNPVNLKSKGVLPIAVLGTDEFDLTQIDPSTVGLTCAGVDEVVLATRCAYEDVATPFEGELCDCHTLGGDGLLDLTLKFSTPELVEMLGLDNMAGETIPLTLTGNLLDEFGGTPIRGEDCVRVQ